MRALRRSVHVDSECFLEGPGENKTFIIVPRAAGRCTLYSTFNVPLQTAARRKKLVRALYFAVEHVVCDRPCAYASAGAPP